MRLLLFPMQEDSDRGLPRRLHRLRGEVLGGGVIRGAGEEEKEEDPLSTGAPPAGQKCAGENQVRVVKASNSRVEG